MVQFNPAPLAPAQMQAIYSDLTALNANNPFAETKVPPRKKANYIPGTIRDELKTAVKFKDYTGRYGIEIETETKAPGDYPEGFLSMNHDTNRYVLPMKEWEGHVDNSLRNFGVEYVLTVPLSFDDALKALDNFASKTDGIKFLKNTPSTSVHVHVNFLDESFLTLANFLTTYALFESVLVDFSGPTRRSNLFALPLRVAERNVLNMTRIFEFVNEGSSSWGLSPGHMKYAACNLAPLQSLGSVEIRSFRGTTDIDEIKDWLGVIEKIVAFAKTDGLTPPDIMSEFRHREMELFSDVFGEFAKVIRDRVEDVEVLIERNLWYAHRVSKAVPDWSEINTRISSKLEQRKSKSKASELLGLQAANTIEWYAPPPPTLEELEESEF